MVRKSVHCGAADESPWPLDSSPHERVQPLRLRQTIVVGECNVRAQSLLNAAISCRRRPCIVLADQAKIEASSLDLWRNSAIALSMIQG